MLPLLSGREINSKLSLFGDIAYFVSYFGTAILKKMKLTKDRNSNIFFTVPKMNDS